MTQEYLIVFYANAFVRFKDNLKQYLQKRGFTQTCDDEVSHSVTPLRERSYMFNIPSDDDDGDLRESAQYTTDSPFVHGSQSSVNQHTAYPNALPPPPLPRVPAYLRPGGRIASRLQEQTQTQVQYERKDTCQRITLRKLESKDFSLPLLSDKVFFKEKWESIWGNLQEKNSEKLHQKGFRKKFCVFHWTLATEPEVTAVISKIREIENFDGEIILALTLTERHEDKKRLKPQFEGVNIFYDKEIYAFLDECLGL